MKSQLEIQLENKLKKEREKQKNKNWNSAIERLETFCKSIRGKYILRWSSSTTFTIYHIQSYKLQYYADISGFDGQWDKRRWVDLKSNAYTISGWFSKTKSFEELKKVDINSSVWLNFKREIHLPINNIKPKKKEWEDKLNSYLDLGIIDKCYYNIIRIGEEEYKNNNFNAINKAIDDFRAASYFIDKEFFDKIESIYYMHFKNIYEFRKSIEYLKLKRL